MTLNPLTFFAAAESGPAIHVAPSTIFYIGDVAITNSIFYGWIVSLILIAFMVTIARRISVRPRGGVVQFVEAAASFIVGTVENAFDDKAKARKYVPFFVTLFFFVLGSNWLGLIPGTGEALTIGETPVFRPFTADLNGTLAAGIVTMGVVYAASVREAGGIRKYLSHFFLGSPLNPLYLVIGILEMFTDLTRVFSLSLRLFLNVTIGEIVIAVFTYLGSYAAPAAVMPFILLELFVGFLQAYIFVMLSVMYLAIAVNSAHGHDEHEAGSLTETEVPGTMSLQSGQA